MRLATDVGWNPRKAPVWTMPLLSRCPYPHCGYHASVVDDLRGNGQRLIDQHLCAHVIAAHWRHLVKE